MKLVTRNIGPSEQLEAEIDGPGLHLLVAENGDGKTSHLRLLRQLSTRKELQRRIHVRDGESEASLTLGPAQVDFTIGPAGDVRVVASGVDQLPAVGDMPATIETLIDGGGLKDSDARARRRIDALLSYAPVAASDDRLSRLLESCRGRVWSDTIPAAVSAAWQALADKLTGTGKRVKFAPPKTAAELRVAVLTDPERSSSVLGDHDALRAELNAIGNCGEAVLEMQRREIAALQARRDTVASSAAAALGSGPTAEVRRQLAEFDLASRETAEERRRMASDTARSCRDARLARVAAEERRARQLAARAPRPELPELPEQAIKHAEAAWKALREAAYYDPKPSEVRTAIAVLRDEMTVVSQSLGDAERHFEIHDRRCVEIAAEQIAWDRLEAELQERIVGPEASDVTEAEARLAKAEHEVALGTHAALYQATEAELRAAVDLATTIDRFAADYRAAAVDCWLYLGTVITDALKLPWLQVDGLEIFLGYAEDGRLNRHPEVLEAAAREAARAAEIASGLNSPVAVQRFILTRIREHKAVTWRSMDDAERISTGELHEAVLSLMLDRPENLSGILVIPPEVIGALSSERLRRLSAQCKERGIIALSERPRRDGDPDGLWVETIAAEVQS
jgi:hypothetical protein